MALFSRGKRASEPSPAPDAESTAHPDAETAHPDAEPAQPESSDAAAAAASVAISTSSFGGFGSTATRPVAEPVTPARPEVAPRATETVPGLSDNVLLREALATLADTPTPQDILGVARQLLQGHLFLRVKGDARTLLSQGKELPLAIATIDDRRFVLAYSSGAALQASMRQDQDADTSAMGQPVLTVIRHVLAGDFEGLIIDPASAPARLMLTRDLLQPMLDGADPELELKTVLVSERTPDTARLVAEALARVRLWVAVNESAEGALGIAEVRSNTGDRFLELYSHPLEVLAMGRGDRPAPMTVEHVKRALSVDEGITGVVVDPAGPWIQLRRGELSAVLSS